MKIFHAIITRRNVAVEWNSDKSLPPTQTIGYYQRPMKRMVSVGRKKFYLSFPGLIFSMHILSSRKSDRLNVVDFKMGSIAPEALFHPNTNKEVIIPYNYNIANCGSSGHVCLGKQMTGVNLEELCKATMDRFWNSRFVLNDRTVMFDDWQNQTKKFPDWVPELENNRRVANIVLMDKFFDLEKEELEKIEYIKGKDLIERTYDKSQCIFNW